MWGCGRGWGLAKEVNRRKANQEQGGVMEKSKVGEEAVAVTFIRGRISRGREEEAGQSKVALSWS